MPDLAELFVQLQDMDSRGQRARLAELSDPALRRRLRAMLAVDDADPRLDPSTGLGVALGVAKELERIAVPPSLGAFTVLRELGRGGMGVVYEGEETRPPRRVALKTLPDPSPNPRSVERFEIEAAAMAAVDHPAVPAVYQLFTEGERPILAMELVRGEPFLASTATMSFDDRIRLLIELSHAVHAIHRVGIVHRDLKPSNLLIGTGGAVRIIDFGIAASGGDAFMPGAGTLSFMAPEQRDGHEPQPSNDVYSLGAISLRVLAGSDALDADAESPTLPPSLASVLRAALHTDPDLRTATAAQFAEQLDGWLESELLRMLSTAAPEAGAAGAGAIRRRAVDSTLATLRRAMASPSPRPDGRPRRDEELATLYAWLHEGVRSISLFGPPGSQPAQLLHRMLDGVGAELTVHLRVEEELLAPLADALKVAAEWSAVQARLRSLGAAVIGIEGGPDVGRDLDRLLNLAPDVRWVFAGPTRIPSARPMQLGGLDHDLATAWVCTQLGVPVPHPVVEEAVRTIHALPALLDPLVTHARVVGTDGLHALDPAQLGEVWDRLQALVGALTPDARTTLVTAAVLPDPCRRIDALAVLGPLGVELQPLIDTGLIDDHDDHVSVPPLIVRALSPTDAELDQARAPWTAWLANIAAMVGDAWIHCRPGVEARLDQIAPHVHAAAPHLSAEDLHHVAAQLADGLIIVGHRATRRRLDQAVLDATPDPLVSRDASLAWVHAIMRQHRRGDMQAVPTLSAIRLAADDADGNLLSQVTHVECSRYAAGNQEPVVEITRHSWERLRAAGQEAWGAWMLGAQAAVSLGMGLEGTELLELAEDAVACMRPEAPELARVFARQALSFAWIDHGRLTAGARLGSTASEEIRTRGMVRIAASFSTYIGKAWFQLERHAMAEVALRTVVDHGVHIHPPHALQWLALMDVERGDTASARSHLAEAERRIPQMEHALLNHHRMCEALCAHADGHLTEARPLYRSLIASGMSRSPTRRSVALCGLLILEDDPTRRDALAAELLEEAATNPIAWPYVRVALGADHVPADQEARSTPLVRILHGFVRERPQGPNPADGEV